MFDDLEAIHLGHADVNQQKINFVFLKMRNGVTRIGDGVHPKTGAREQTPAQQGNAGFVIHNQNKR